MPLRTAAWDKLLVRTGAASSMLIGLLAIHTVEATPQKEVLICVVTLVIRKALHILPAFPNSRYF